MENQNQNKTVSDVPTIMLRDRNTTYVIGLNFSRSSRETYADKANRLIRNDVKAGNFWAKLKPNFQKRAFFELSKILSLQALTKGSIGVECGEALLKHGYKLKFFNTINFSKSMRYNPMAYMGLIQYRSHDAAVHWNIGVCSLSMIVVLLISVAIVATTKNASSTKVAKKPKKNALKKGW